MSPGRKAMHTVEVIVSETKAKNFLKLESLQTADPRNAEAPVRIRTWKTPPIDITA